MCTDFYGLLNTYRKQCQRHAQGLHGTRIFSYGDKKIVHDISGHKRELSGYLITLFMSTWDDEKVHLPLLKDGCDLRKQILGQLLTFKENECEDNMPAGVLEFINCIRKIQADKNVKI